jgi:small conductance mechanosensitive channel
MTQSTTTTTAANGSATGSATAGSPTPTPAGGVPGAGSGEGSILAGLTDFVHTTFPDLPMQVLASLLALCLLALAGWAVRTVGPRLKAHVDGAAVESLQAGVMTIVTAVVGVFLIAVWRAGGMVQQAVGTASLSQDAIIKLVLTVAILAGAYSLTRVSKNFIKRVLRQRSAVSNHHQEVAHHITQIGIYVLAGLVVLGLWGVRPESLVVGAGVATVVLGFAARQTLGAVLAGFVVLFSRPFELGDWVVVDDKEGVVTDITVVNTQIRTFDEEYVMIPNDLVTATEVVNRSKKGRLRLETDVGVDYDTDLDEAMEVAKTAMADLDVLMDRPEPNVVLAEFGSSSVVLRLRYYIQKPSARKMWKARTDVISAVKHAFAEEGIKIPFPQRELSGRAERGGFEVVADDLPASGAEQSSPEQNGEGSE